MHHTFQYISLPLLHDYDLEMPNFTIYGERKLATSTKFSFPFWTWTWFLAIQLPRTVRLDMKKEVNRKRLVTKIEKTWIYFLSDVFAAIGVTDIWRSLLTWSSYRPSTPSEMFNKLFNLLCIIIIPANPAIPAEVFAFLYTRSFLLEQFQILPSPGDPDDASTPPQGKGEKICPCTLRWSSNSVSSQLHKASQIQKLHLS